jgi:hypothetical protein
MEPWFSMRMSAGGCRLGSERVGLEPDAAKVFFMVSPQIQREAPEEIIRWGKAKVGFCPLQAASLQTLEAGTAAFFLARLPGR